MGDYVARITNSTAEECRSCQAIDSSESIFHFLCECPALGASRQKFLKYFFFDNLEELASVDLDGLLRFIKSTKWFYD